MWRPLLLHSFSLCLKFAARSKAYWKSAIIPSNPLCSDIKTFSKMGSSALEHSIKVRKPYTISKQRERWTEKEHNKFLESLKLYGRAWRQIQEYVGTKSAVQIRSHAQKFFTKVVRGTGEGDNSDKVETIQIPPPRPKRKPMHSYPRKVGYLPAIPVKEKLDWPLYPKILVSKQEDSMFLRKLTLSEQDNLSPTSVLSTVGSDTFGSSGSNFMNNSVSPTSSAVGSEDPVVISMSEQENGGRQLEEDESLLQQKSSHKSNMEVEDMGTDDSIVNKEASEMEATTTTSVKLFGRIVMVTDSEKPGYSEPEQDCPKQEVDQSATDKKSSEQGSWPSRVIPMFYFLPTFGESEAPAMANPHLSVSEQEQDSSMEHSGYCCSVPTMKLRPGETSAFRSLKAPSNKPTKCSVPYRSCVTVKEVENRKMENANADETRCRFVLVDYNDLPFFLPFVLYRGIGDDFTSQLEVQIEEFALFCLLLSVKYSSFICR